MNDDDKCRDCGEKAGSDAYWWSVRGGKLGTPRCRDCHETYVRRLNRYDENVPAVSQFRRRTKKLNDNH